MRRREKVGASRQTSWTGSGEVQIRAARPHFNPLDAAFVAGLAFIYDIVAFLVIGIPTGVGGIECTDDGCQPPPAHAIHVASIGLVLMVIATAVPVVVALVWRRAIVLVIIVQLAAGALLVGHGIQNLGAAHTNLREICANAPELAHTRCPS
jgi:hypothetical protein